jgi:hypothetical protein
LLPLNGLLTRRAAAGNPSLKFLKSMEAEHCARFDSARPFTTNNYHVTTTPQAEWRIVLTCDEAAADMRCDRRIPVLAELMEREVAKTASLSDFEVISVVLYTGPMVSRPAAARSLRADPTRRERSA